MRLYTFKKTQDSEPEIGVESLKDQDYILPLSQFGYQYDMTRFVQNVSAVELAELKERLISEKNFEEFDKEQLILCAPIMHPQQDIICLGINYEEHAKESARYKKEEFGGPREFPVYFSKRVNEAVPDHGFIPSYTGIVDSLDYECELAVVIGRDAKDIKEEDAFTYIFGYTIVNDVSARNIQTRHKQWYYGKSFDGFTPMGPCIVTADEFEAPPELAIKSYVNGELRQNSNTSLLIAGIARVLSELSQGMTLQAGTIVSTGTPSGVGMGFVPPKFLISGDTVVCEVEGIGKITNIVM